VICSNNMTAIGVLHTTQRLGRRIPDEMSLIGFDDLLMSQIVQPALTTLHHCPAADRGARLYEFADGQRERA